MDSKPTGLVAVISMLFLFIQIICPAGVAGDITGVCYGRNGNNLPSPADTIALYKRNNIDAIRMYEPFADMLEALRGSGLSVAFGPRNEAIQSLAQDPAAATNFVATWILPYKNDVAIKWITIGNEVFPGDIAPFVAAAIRNVNTALTNSGVSGIAVTTVVAMSALENSYPPSAASFLPDLTEIMTEISSILSQTNSPLMANIYPYFAYASDPKDISLDYAVFKSNTPVVIDGDLKYSNMFVAMVDGFNAALEKINARNVVVTVAESGWPTEGNPPYTSVDNAREYNLGLLTCGGATRMRTPRRPETAVDVFLFEMFRENQKQGPVEESFGMFSPDMTPVSLQEKAPHADSHLCRMIQDAKKKLEKEQMHSHAMELGLIASSSVLKDADYSDDLIKVAEVVEKRINVLRERIQALQ